MYAPSRLAASGDIAVCGLSTGGVMGEMHSTAFRFSEGNVGKSENPEAGSEAESGPVGDSCSFSDCCASPATPGTRLIPAVIPQASPNVPKVLISAHSGDRTRLSWHWRDSQHM